MTHKYGPWIFHEGTENPKAGARGQIWYRGKYDPQVVIVDFDGTEWNNAHRGRAVKILAYRILQEPEMTQKLCNVYANGTAGGAHETKDSADRVAKTIISHRIAMLIFTYHDGEYHDVRLEKMEGE